MVVLGIKHSSGDFNGIHFDNYYFHCLLEQVDGTDYKGQLTEVLKVPKSVFDNFSVNVGDTVNPAYNKYGKLISL